MTFLETLKTNPMLLIDGLHVFDFSLDEAGALRAEAMDGRESKRWSFSAQAVAAATLDGDTWSVQGEAGPQRIVCLNAFSASDDETDPA